MARSAETSSFEILRIAGRMSSARGDPRSAPALAISASSRGSSVPDQSGVGHGESSYLPSWTGQREAEHAEPRAPHGNTVQLNVEVWSARCRGPAPGGDETCECWIAIRAALAVAGDGTTSADRLQHACGRDLAREDIGPTETQWCEVMKIRRTDLRDRRMHGQRARDRRIELPVCLAAQMPDRVRRFHAIDLG